MLICVLVSLNSKAQSISFTTLPTTAKVGSVLTVNYKYTSTTTVNIACGINLLDTWSWISYVGGQYRTAPPGTDVTGSFSITIPATTLPSDYLPGKLNYKILIEMKNPATNSWITGAYPATPINLTLDSKAKINFSYDTEGNQTGRNFVWISSGRIASPKTKETVVSKEADSKKFPLEDVVSFYPNPVHDELQLDWELTENNTVIAISVLDIKGQLIQSFSNNLESNSRKISFLSYPPGLYAVVLLYGNGKQKSIKIIKQ